MEKLATTFGLRKIQQENRRCTCEIKTHIKVVLLLLLGTELRSWIGRTQEMELDTEKASQETVYNPSHQGMPMAMLMIVLRMWPHLSNKNQE